MAGIYIIEHESGMFYLGTSNDIFSRWQGHYTLLKQNKHHSSELQSLFNSTQPEEWIFKVIKYLSRTKFKERTKLKGEDLELAWRRFLLMEEKICMRNYSINLCLNKDKKHFK